MKKRLLSALLVFCMICTFLPVNTLAATAGDHAIKLELVKDTTTFSGKEVLRVDFKYKSGSDTPNNQMVYLKYDANKLYPAAQGNGADASSAATNFSTDKSSTFTKNNFAKDDGFGGSENSEVKLYTIIEDGFGYICWKVTEPNETAAFNELTRISSIFFGLKEGVTFDALPKDAIKLATVADDKSVTNQTNSISITTNGNEALKYGSETSSDNNLTVDLNTLFTAGDGVTFAKATLPTDAKVELSATAKIGTAITATTSNMPSDAGNLTYTWYRVDGTNETNISDASGSSYTPNAAADVGKKIKVVVTADNYSGELTATTSGAVAKGDGPSAPTIAEVSKTDTSIAVTGNSAWEYSNNSGGSWQDGNVFTGLTANTAYSIVARVKETATHNASENSSEISITTNKTPAGTPVAPVVEAKTDASITVTAVSGQKYMIKKSAEAAPTASDSGWGDTVAFTGLDRNTAYKVYTYIPEGTTAASEVVFTEVTTEKTTVTDTLVSVNTTEKTYSAEAQEPDFSGSLTRGTSYTVAYSVKTDGQGELKDGKPCGAGTYVVTVSGTGDYTGSFQKDFTIAKKAVTITPSSGQSKTYGAADPALTYTTDIDGDTTLKGKFDTAKSGELSYTGTNVGTYPIGLGTLAAGNNFHLTLASTAVNFTINQATPSITATTPRQLVKNNVEVDITGWASFNNTDSGAKLTYALEGTPTGITLTADNKLKAENDASTVFTFNIKVSAAATTNFTAPTEQTIVVNVVDKADAGVSITGAPANKTYGDANFTLTATKTAPDDGTWSWNSSNTAILAIVFGENTATPTIKINKADASGATLTVTYTSSTHYGSANATITVAPKTLTAADLTYSGSTTKVYDGSTDAPSGLTVSVKSDSLVGEDTLTVTGTLAYNSANVNAANKITFTPTAITTGNYALANTEVLTISGAKITQATPTYTAPTGLTAKYGQTLADVNIASTTGWSWMNTGTAVGAPATKNFPAKFTPTDTTNYKTIENINVSVAVGKADAPALTNIAVSQKYTVTTGEKAIGTVMPADAGTLTYARGTAATTGSVTVTSWDVYSTGKVTYTLSGGAVGNTVTLPVTIGSDNYADATVNVVITLTAKDDQTALTLTGGTTVVYGQTLQLGTSGGSGTGAVTYAVTNGTGKATIDATGKLTPVKVGTVKVKATKAEDANYNAITSAEVEIHITRATPTGAPKYTAITTSGKTLADAGLTTVGSTLNPNAGTLVWVDNAGDVLPDTTAVAANTTYKWRFTPTDTTNYTTLTGSIELYHKSGSGGGGRYYTYYTIEATAGTNGSISPSGWTSVRDGRDQTFTITPDKGYAVAKVLVDGKSVGAVKSYTFKNVMKDHTIEAIFMKSNGNPQTGVFVDVAEGSYYEEAIDWAVEKGITNGVSSNMFAPNDPCTRAQIVTFLWRAAGSPAPKSMSSFTDVPADAFYAKAVAWAVENGITSGTGEGKFSPNSTCTRAQAVTFLYRASGSPAVSGTAEFSDVSTTAFYADAVTWAAKKGITTGIGGGLFGSNDDCTRGQIVTFLWRVMAE